MAITTILAKGGPARWAGLLGATLGLTLFATACGNDNGDTDSPPAPTPTAAAFDPALASKLQAALDAAVSSDGTNFPGAMLRVSSPEFGTWAGASGLGQLEPAIAADADNKIRGGSIVKTMVAVTVLQLAEEGAISLDDTLAERVPQAVSGQFPDSNAITLRMLLNHTSGLPEWNGPSVHAQIAANPTKVWTTEEFLGIAAALPLNFRPGAGYAYSNTDYTLLGEVIEQATGKDWRDAVTERVIRRAGLGETSLPAPGDRSIEGPHAHGYAGNAASPIDLTDTDPSMAGSAGGGALVTTMADLIQYWDAVLGGRLFKSEATLREMLTFVDAPDVGGQVGYGLGVQRYVLPNGDELIGHLGGTAGYMTIVGYLPQQNATIVASVNMQEDPSPVLLPAIEALASR